ncbi:hypothetical protein PAHAL_3G291200 [Panicum hallii]|uniref:Uncharacterized protein n=1 Tax=Panicum hallii TaxID=206008 RepID=A0A2S3HCC6_9POAL|nr:hypothetical protein PAHAL_3G291200 [Panicum hallii]
MSREVRRSVHPAVGRSRWRGTVAELHLHLIFTNRRSSSMARQKRWAPWLNFHGAVAVKPHTLIIGTLGLDGGQEQKDRR